MPLQNLVVCHLVNVPYYYYFKNWINGDDEYFDLNSILSTHEKKKKLIKL